MTGNASEATEAACRALAAVRRIVVHPGLAHVDDIMACAVAYAFGVPHDVPIERRKPTSEELASPETLVLDVGFLHDPARLDFDHHQRARHETPKCSFRLLAEWLDVASELALLFPWFEIWNQLDTRGPYETAALIGTTGAQIAGLVGHPLGEWVIRHFADDPAFRQKVALGLAKEIDKTRRCWAALKEKAVQREIAGLAVADFRSCGTDEISRCSDVWLRLRPAACLISRDGRGTGLTFLRYADDPRLDFSRCAGRPYVLFAHPGGFILKTQSLEDDPAEILRDARVDA